MKNQQKEAPLEYYRAKYRQIDTAEAAQRTGLEFDSKNGRFMLEALGHRVFAQWPELKLVPDGDNSCPEALYGFEMTIVTARYIVQGAGVPSHGQFMAYRELPWGDVYDPNFKGHIINGLARKFGTNPGNFAKAAEKLGGTKNNAGDVSFDLPFLGGVTCRLILWTPDDEFPASAQMLFSDNTSFAFDAEALVGVGSIIIEALKQAISPDMNPNTACCS